MKANRYYERHHDETAYGRSDWWLNTAQRNLKYSPDNANGDRLVTAVVGLVAALVGVVVPVVAQGKALAVWVALVTLCVTPGCAIACWLSTKERLTRAVAVLAASLTWTILVTSILAWLQVTMLGVLLMATAGAGGIGSAVYIIAHLARQRKRPSIARSRPRLFAYSYWFKSPLVFLMCLLAIAAVLLAIAVGHARHRPVGAYGLLPLLGVKFVVAVVLTVAVLVFALWRIRSAWPATVAALVLLLVELNGTPMWIATNPLGNYTYKHFGVVDYIVHGGALKDPLDIYQQWPGFFAAAAGLERLSGRGPLAYANWAQLFFEMLDALVLFAIAYRFSKGYRVVPYVTVLLFVTVNWEGQFYYSPQSTALLLALLFQFFLLSEVEPGRLRPWLRRRRWLGDFAVLQIEKKEQISVVAITARFVGLIALFTAMIITHQLSPFVVFAGAVGLWLAGVLRLPLLLLIIADALIAFLLLHSQAIGSNQLLTGFSLSNATGVAGLLPASRQEAVASILAKTISLGFWAATAVCVISYRRRLGIVVIPIILAAVPISFVLITNYDGEAIYRAFLFSSPWCALVIARRVADMPHLRMLRWVVVGIWGLYAGLGSAQAQDFGLYPQMQVTSADINVSEYFLDHAPVNSEIVTVAEEDFPSRLNRNYVLHNVTQTQNDPSLDLLPAFLGNRLNRVSPQVLAQKVSSMAGGDGYLVVSPSMQADIIYYGEYTPNTLSALVPRLEASKYWRVWYHHDGTVIFQALPQGNNT